MVDDENNNNNSTDEVILLTNGFNHQSVPQSYIQPLEKRPTNPPPSLHSSSTTHQNTPIIDFRDGSDQEFHRADIIHQIFKAIEEFGFFQLINHGISEEMMDEVMSLGKEFFEMPFEERSKWYCDSRQTTLRVASSVRYEAEEVHYWRDSLRHACHPLEEFIHAWPSKPAKYREVVGPYCVKMRALALKLMELIAEGLGLKSNYFDEGDITQMQSMVVNHYPLCPDPSLTLGLPKHSDPNVITILTQDVFGLQVLKDGEWMNVEPLPHAFVVFLGLQMQVISNDKLKSADHRVLTNSTTARTTITTQMSCTMECTMGPAEELLDKINPAKYRPYNYQEFFETYLAASLDTEETMKHYKL
ncbi:hypothetical protein Sjap_008980 [Stephania japonica]|uniref:Fe2OG dioxygenase domain-containing protein n=1 Tax=Stephania japonica TaxID=461633 RepID=A0AAP0PF02_9MAGN